MIQRIGIRNFARVRVAQVTVFVSPGLQVTLTSHAPDLAVV